jgi:hypothetical protein
MEWVFDNLKLVIFAIVIVVYAIKAMRGKADASGTHPTTSHTPEAGGDPAEAERTRQIQEEIRRRILARQRGEEPSTPPPLVVVREAPPVHAPRKDEWTDEPETPASPPPLPATAYAQPSEATAVLEQQRALEEKLRLVRLTRDAARAGIPALAQPNARFGSTDRATAAQRALRHDLAHPTSLRRAILLREVLGEPVGLRSGALPRR